ncbi:MAG: DNA-binding domain-containing protein [Terrimicrobiaceae bacterium]
MASAIMRRLTPDERTQPTDSDGRATEVTAAEYIKPNDRLTSLERLEIYNRQYWFRLLDCLIDDFPGLRAVLGDGRFYPLIISYLESHPSSSPLLGDLGKNLPAFIAGRKSLTAPHTWIAGDVARLEWAQIVAFDRGGRPPLNPSLIASTPPDKLTLRLQPHITLLDLAYPVEAVVLRLLRKDRSLRNGSSNAVGEKHVPRKFARAGRISRRRTRLLVHRHENSVYFKPLTQAQFLLLEKLAAGSTLAAACDILVEAFPSTKSEDVRSWFASWQHFGFFIRR